MKVTLESAQLQGVRSRFGCVLVDLDMSQAEMFAAMTSFLEHIPQEDFEAWREKLMSEGVLA